MKVSNQIFFKGNNPRNYNGQRYNQRQNQQTYSGPPAATNNPNMYAMPPPQYMMSSPAGTPDGNIQNLMNNKFFQTGRMAGGTNPCAYQSMGQNQGPYNQYSAPMQYAPYSPYTQPPAAAVQQ